MIFNAAYSLISFWHEINSKSAVYGDAVASTLVVVSIVIMTVSAIITGTIAIAL